MPSKSVLIAQAFSKTGVLSTVVDSAPSIDTGLDLLAINQNIIPSLDSSYDLGSPTHKWKDMYLSGGTLHIGGVVIKEDTANPGKIVFEDSAGSVAFSTSGSLEVSASGTLANGDLVVINSDETVSVVASSSVSQTVGSLSVFGSSETRDPAIVYDASTQKVVVAYREIDGPHTLQAVVGTVSGTSISFGTPVEFYGNQGSVGNIVYDENAQKIVIFYHHSNNAYAIVGTVSGTSISFGSAVQFSTHSCYIRDGVYDPSSQKVVGFYEDWNANLGYAAVGTVSGTSISFGSPVQYATDPAASSAVYDSNAQKLVICWLDWGTSANAVVGTVSGTSISFGSVANFTSANQIESINMSYDTSAQKVVIVYSDNVNSEYGTAVVGTVSGNSISFGTPVVFDSTKARNTTISYDSNANKHVIFYNRGYGADSKFIVGTVSGTSISFGSIVQAYNGWALETGSVYDPNSDKVVVVFKNWSNSDYGTSIVFQNSNPNVTNLTSTNYIGISDGAYSNGETAIIQTAGSVDDAQSGLTVGKQYFVQNDGTLSTSPDTPSVFAGTAISSNKIIIKG
jgi:hypothetical protein